MTKYTTIIKMGLLSVLTLVATSCANELNVEPNTSIDAENALNTSSDIRGALIGCYDMLGSNDFAGGGTQYLPDLIADNGDIIFRGSFTTILEMWRKSIQTTSSQPLATWNDGYETINRANNVLANLDKLDSEEEKLAVEGEARFIRGFAFFNLVRMYARAWGDGNEAENPGVPLPLTPSAAPLDESIFLPRASVAEVYAQIIEDLTTAESSLANGNLIPNGATSFAATAILSRVYMTQSNFAEARDAADRVIESGEFALVNNYSDVFNDYMNRNGSKSPEAIFSSMITVQDGVNDLHTFYAASENGGRGDIRIQSQHLELYDENDARGQFFYRGNNNATYTSKYMDQFANVTIIRLAELYLNRAEANERLGTDVGATPAEDVSLLLERAGLPAVTSITLDEILRQRKLELAFEGEELFDLKRTGRAITNDLAFNAPATILPIPQREMDTNTNLVQNDAYPGN